MHFPALCAAAPVCQLHGTELVVRAELCTSRFLLAKQVTFSALRVTHKNCDRTHLPGSEP